MSNSIKLNRNIIYSIGYKTVKIEKQNTETNECLESWNVSKVIRRKNKVKCYDYLDTIGVMIFKTIQYAKIFIKQFKIEINKKNNE